MPNDIALIEYSGEQPFSLTIYNYYVHPYRGPNQERGYGGYDHWDIANSKRDGWIMHNSGGGGRMVSVGSRAYPPQQEEHKRTVWTPCWSLIGLYDQQERDTIRVTRDELERHVVLLDDPITPEGEEHWDPRTFCEYVGGIQYCPLCDDHYDDEYTCGHLLDVPNYGDVGVGDQHSGLTAKDYKRFLFRLFDCAAEHEEHEGVLKIRDDLIATLATGKDWHICESGPIIGRGWISYQSPEMLEMRAFNFMYDHEDDIDLMAGMAWLMTLPHGTDEQKRMTRQWLEEHRQRSIARMCHC